MNDSSLYKEDFLFDTGNAGRLESVRQSLPQVVTQGSTIVVDGQPQFKAPLKIACPRCEGELHRGKTTLVFRLAPNPERRSQEVEGSVCECGEAYVPGQTAREAHRRAMIADDVRTTSGAALRPATR